MSLDDVLTLLDQVRHTSHGWQARCPAHDDRHPSLSIKEGDEGLLVKCWSGCDLEAICAAVHIRVADLFYKTTKDPRAIRAAHQARRHRQQARTAAHRRDHRRIARLHAAERLITVAHDLDISSWTDEQLHRELETLADAYALLQEERDAAV